MEVILLEKIDKLGQMGDVVKVKNGFARNFLLPRKKALRANKTNRKYFEDKRVELEAVNLQRKDEAKIVADKMEGLHIIIVRQASEGGQLYGSVSSRDITTALKDQGIKIEKGQIDLNSPVKELGKFNIPVKLHPEVEIEIAITVSRSDELSENDIENQNTETNNVNFDDSSAEKENITKKVDDNNEK